MRRRLSFLKPLPQVVRTPPPWPTTPRNARHLWRGHGHHRAVRTTQASARDRPGQERVPSAATALTDHEQVSFTAGATRQCRRHRWEHELAVQFDRLRDSPEGFGERFVDLLEGGRGGQRGLDADGVQRHATTRGFDDGDPQCGQTVQRPVHADNHARIPADAHGSDHLFTAARSRRAVGGIGRPRGAGCGKEPARFSRILIARCAARGRCSASVATGPSRYHQ
jgi:hypothetical protein